MRNVSYRGVMRMFCNIFDLTRPPTGQYIDSRLVQFHYVPRYPSWEMEAMKAMAVLIHMHYACCFNAIEASVDA